MKKRKELNALVSGGKSRCSNNNNKSASSVACGYPSGSRELLNNDCSDTSDTEETSAFRTSKSVDGRKVWRLYSACVPLCMLTVVTASVVGTAVLIWMHLALRQEVDTLRIYFRKVESGTRKTPEELHVVHSRLNLLEGNSSVDRDTISKLGDTVLALKNDLDSLRKTTDNLSKSIAAAPQIVTLPQTVQTLQQSVASLGSKLTDLDTAVKEMKNQAGSSNEYMQINIDKLEKKIESVLNQTQVQSTTLQTSLHSQLYEEELQRLTFYLEDVNKTAITNHLKILDDLRDDHEKMAYLENRTNLCIDRSENLDTRIKRLQDESSQIDDIVREKVNETIEELLGNRQEKHTKNNITKQTLSGINSELPINNSQHKKDKLDTDNDRALSTTPVQAQPNESSKMLANTTANLATDWIPQLRQDLNGSNLNKTATITSRPIMATPIKEKEESIINSTSNMKNLS